MLNPTVVDAVPDGPQARAGRHQAGAGEKTLCATSWGVGDVQEFRQLGPPVTL